MHRIKILNKKRRLFKIPHPTTCDVYVINNETYIILGNSFNSDGSIWAFNCDKRKMDQIILENSLKLDPVPFDDVLRQMEERALSGCSESMWWCAWAYEGINHRRSVWYYIASLRANPEMHGWAFERLYHDAHSAILCEGIPAPCLEFLNDIPEFKTFELGDDWANAVNQAISATL